MRNNNYNKNNIIHITDRLKELIKKRWIYLEATEDARRKQLQITAEGMRHFAKLGSAIQKLHK